MGHARPDTANVRDVLLAEPDRVGFAGRALPRGPFLRGGGPRPEREREAQERRSGYDRPEVWLGGRNVHYRPPIWLSWYLLLKRRPRQAEFPPAHLLRRQLSQPPPSYVCEGSRDPAFLGLGRGSRVGDAVSAPTTNK
jgi:hypothetical protein